MKKGCALAGAVIVLVVAVVIFMVLRLTASMVEDGEKFLDTLGSGSTELAYGMTSATLRTSQSLEDFTRTIKAYGLDGFESASWSSRSISNDRGTLEGTARTKSGGSVPLTIGLIKEDGAWKVLSIKGPQAGASTGPIIAEESGAAAKPALPDTTAASSLLVASLLSFNDAIQSKSFDTFHAGLATIWKNQTSPSELLEKFRSFIDSGVDIAPIKELEPIFASPPAFDEDGLLKLEGHYATTPQKVHFTLRYNSEEEGWKLVGIHVRVRD